MNVMRNIIQLLISKKLGSLMMEPTSDKTLIGRWEKMARDITNGEDIDADLLIGEIQIQLKEEGVGFI